MKLTGRLREFPKAATASASLIVELLKSDVIVPDDVPVIKEPPLWLKSVTDQRIMVGQSLEYGFVGWSS